MRYSRGTLSDFIEFNPRESLPKGNVSKEIAMADLMPFQKKISNYNISPYKGGMKFRNGDTLLARITPCLENGKTVYVDILNEDEVGFGSTEYIVLRAIPQRTIPEFVFYFAISDWFRKRAIALMTGSSGRQRVQTDKLMDLEVIMPDLETQGKIVRVLSALDQKIELNNQQSKVLETAAFALYDDFINNIDESNFEKVAIGQIADCKLGGTPSRAKTEYWGGSINWINSGVINSFRITGPSELITEEGFKHTSTYVLPKGTTVLAITGATLGQVSRMEIEGCANQSVIGIVGNNAISNEYIYLTIVRNIQEIINRQTGGAQQHINKNDIKEFEIILPNQQLMNNFTNKVGPIFEKIAQNEFENKTLSSLRNAILPELMSGEINLNEATIYE